jgi:LacI family transcriptional regulator
VQAMDDAVQHLQRTEERRGSTGSRITISDVARAANVSTQTVSRVINNKGEIRPETRQKVLEIIETLGYRPNPLARGLATNRTATIGVVVPDIGNPFFADVVRGAEDVAREHGFRIFLSNVDQDPDREETTTFAMEDMRVSGILICSPRLPDERLEAVLAKLERVVLINRDYVNGAVGAVRLDDLQAATTATLHSVQRGRKRIVLLAGRPGGPAFRTRLQGFREAMALAGREIDERQILYCTSNPEGGYDATCRALDGLPDTDALICFNDLVAIGAMRACTDRGVRVPDDVTVTGFGDTILARMVHPSLTTMHQPGRKLGAGAVELLIQHINGEQHEREVIVHSRLVIRESAP